MLFSGSLTDFAIRRMEGYLAHKWGSNARLVAGHPFKANRPLFGGSQSISLTPTNIPTDSSDNVPFMSIFDSAFELEGVPTQPPGLPSPMSRTTLPFSRLPPPVCSNLTVRD